MIFGGNSQRTSHFDDLCGHRRRKLILKQQPEKTLAYVDTWAEKNAVGPGKKVGLYWLVHKIVDIKL